MTEFFHGNWWLVLFGILAFALIAWWIGLNSRRTRVERTSKGDVLDQGAERAKRNQTLIDAQVVPMEPPVESAPPSPAQEPAGEDDLTRIKGLGPKLANLLRSLGVTSFEQIAAWSEEDIDRVDAQLGDFSGRIRRDNWIEQAKFLAAGDMAAFEGKFGKL